MILFLEDWDKYPTAKPDFETNNKSFLEYAKLLNAMGIKNHTFCLALIDQELKGVNPHDPNLKPITMARIAIESKSNPWYFFREVLRVPPSGGPDPVPLQANRGNISLYWLFFNHVTTMLIQPRQTGKSLSTDGLMVMLMNVSATYTDIHLLTKDDGLRVKNIARIKELMNRLPAFFKIKDKTDSNNTEKITINKLGNVYKTAVAQASEKAAQNVGRGETIMVNHVDEIAFVKNIKYSLPVLLAASTAARDNAKRNNAPYGNLFTTTPGYLNSESGRFAYKIYKDCCKWSEEFFDCKNEEELCETIIKNSPAKKLQVILEFNHRQLGKTDEWLTQAINVAMSEGEDVGADFLNLWAEGSEASPIPKEILKTIQDSAFGLDPYVSISSYGYQTRWYVPKHEVMLNCPTRKLIMGLDTSDAIGNDDIAMVIRDASTGEVVAAGNYNETNLIVFSEWLVEWLTTYDNLILVPERKSSAIAIIDNLIKLLPLKGIDPFKRIFNWVVNDAADNKTYYDEVINVPFNRRNEEVYVKYRKQFGFATAGGSGRQSRDALYGVAFLGATKYTGNTCKDKILITQLSSLVRKNGRIDHREGEHDDSVIGWLLSYWFLTEAKNKAFYGLSNQMILAEVLAKMLTNETGMVDPYEQQKQLRLQRQVGELMEQLKFEKNPIKISLIISRIRHVSNEISTEKRQSLNIEALIENIMLEKKRITKAA